MRDSSSMGVSGSPGKAVERGGEALARGAWEEARVHFADTVAEADSAEAREGLAWTLLVARFVPG